MSFGGEISIDKQPLGDTVNSVVLFSFTELITVPVDRGQSDSAESWDFFFLLQAELNPPEGGETSAASTAIDSESSSDQSSLHFSTFSRTLV